MHQQGDNDNHGNRDSDQPKQKSRVQHPIAISTSVVLAITHTALRAIPKRGTACWSATGSPGLTRKTRVVLCFGMQADECADGTWRSERFACQATYVTMSEFAPERRPHRRPGLLIAAGLVVVIATGAGLAWMQSDRALSNTTTAASPPQTSAQTPRPGLAQSAPPVTPSDEPRAPLDQLKQQVNELDTDGKNLAQQLDATKRQLSETQGDLKLLSEQLGSLSERLDSLSASRASMPIGVETDPKKPAKSR